ncbi:MAG: hypothetical protein M3Z06_12090 [Actinomycetota bacterium]|nr:hypothetical protein [Actinomycetota bacterium]
MQPLNRDLGARHPGPMSVLRVVVAAAHQVGDFGPEALRERTAGGNGRGAHRVAWRRWPERRDGEQGHAGGEAPAGDPVGDL